MELSPEQEARRDELMALYDTDMVVTAQAKVASLYEAFPDFPVRAKGKLSDRAIVMVIASYDEHVEFERQALMEQEAQFLSVCAALEGRGDLASIVTTFWDAQMSVSDKREHRAQDLLNRLPIEDLLFLEEGSFQHLPPRPVLISDHGISRVKRQLSVEFPDSVRHIVESKCARVRRDVGKPWIYYPPVIEKGDGFATYESGGFTRGE